MGGTTYSVIINRLGYNSPPGSSFRFASILIREGSAIDGADRVDIAGKVYSEMPVGIRLVVEAGIGFAQGLRDRGGW